MTNTVIGFHYTVKTQQGDLIDSSEGESPLLFLAGVGQIIPKLEEKLLALKVGDKDQIDIDAKDAYGEVQSELKLTVQKSQFPDGEIKIGDQFKVNEDPNAPLFTITEIKGEDVLIDGNHPLAGIDLSFDVELTEKRDATEEELAHGHAHGDGGHQH